MSVTVFDEIKNRFYSVCTTHGFLDKAVHIMARVLSENEAIGNPEASDFPLQKGKERLMEAEFSCAKGQAYTDQYGLFEGRLEEIFVLPLNNNFRRAIFVSALNAVMRSIGKIENTIHCKDTGPAQCALELAEAILDQYGRIRITQVGFQPRMVEQLSSTFEYRVLDMDPDNIGKQKGRVTVEGYQTVHEAIAWADLLLVTGTTLVNNTIEDFLVNKPILFYGTTIAGVAHLMGWDRFCARST